MNVEGCDKTSELLKLVEQCTRWGVIMVSRVSSFAERVKEALCQNQWIATR